MLDAGARVFGYRYNGYWQDVGTIQSYWEANMALLEDDPELDLYDKDWVIHTRSEERAPAKVGPDRPGPPEPDQPRLRDRRDGRELGPLAGRPGRGRGGRARLDRHVRLGHPLGRRRRPLDPRQGGRGRPGRASSATGRSPTAEQAGARPPEHRASPSSASGRSSLAASRIGRNVQVAADVRTSDFVERVVRSGESVEPKPSHARRATTMRRGRRRRAGGAAAADAAAAARPPRPAEDRRPPGGVLG